MGCTASVPRHNRTGSTGSTGSSSDRGIVHVSSITVVTALSPKGSHSKMAGVLSPKTCAAQWSPNSAVFHRTASCPSEGSASVSGGAGHIHVECFAPPRLARFDSTDAFDGELPTERVAAADEDTGAGPLAQDGRGWQALGCGAKSLATPFGSAVAFAGGVAAERAIVDEGRVAAS